MPVSRRGFLGAVAVSPVMADHVAREEMKVAALPSLSEASELGVVGTAPAPNRYTTFAEWFMGVGKDQIKAEARSISGLDADLIERRQPLATKVRLQRARNYDRILEGRKSWFARQIGNRGYIEWWD